MTVLGKASHTVSVESGILLQVVYSWQLTVTVAAWGSWLCLVFDPALTLTIPCSEASILTPVFCNDPHGQRQSMVLNETPGGGGGESSWTSTLWGWGQQGRPGAAPGESWVQTSKAFSHYCIWFASNLIDPGNFNLATCPEKKHFQVHLSPLSSSTGPN